MIDFLRDPLVASIIGILAIMISLSYLILKKRQKPCFAMRSNNIVSDYKSLFSPIKITHNGSEIDSLTVTRVAFWNGGRKAFGKKDIAEEDPYTFSMREGNEILDKPEIINMTGKRNVKIKGDQKIRIDFDFLEKNEYVVIQVLHTGKTSDDLIFEGKTKDVKNLNLSGAWGDLSDVFFTYYFFFCIIFLSSSIIVAACFNSFYLSSSSPILNAPFNIVFDMMIVFLELALTIYLLKIARRLNQKTFFPKTIPRKIRKLLYPEMFFESFETLLRIFKKTVQARKNSETKRSEED